MHCYRPPGSLGLICKLEPIAFLIFSLKIKLLIDIPKIDTISASHPPTQLVASKVSQLEICQWSIGFLATWWPGITPTLCQCDRKGLVTGKGGIQELWQTTGENGDTGTCHTTPGTPHSHDSLSGHICRPLPSPRCPVACTGPTPSPGVLGCDPLS